MKRISRIIVALPLAVLALLYFPVIAGALVPNLFWCN